MKALAVGIAPFEVNAPAFAVELNQDFHPARAQRRDLSIPGYRSPLAFLHRGLPGITGKRK
jgi:hypothetical protein